MDYFIVCVIFYPLEPLAPRLIHPSHESSSFSISFSSFILSEWNNCWRGYGKLKFSFVENNVIVWIGLVVAFLCDTVCLWHCVKDETVKTRRGNNIKHLFVPIRFDSMPLLILWLETSILFFFALPYLSGFRNELKYLDTMFNDT